MNASSRTIVAHNPELGMDLKGIIEGVDVLGLAIGQLLQDLDLMNGDFNGVVFCSSVNLVVSAIDIDNL